MRTQGRQSSAIAEGRHGPFAHRQRLRYPRCRRFREIDSPVARHAPRYFNLGLDPADGPMMAPPLPTLWPGVEGRTTLNLFAALPCAMAPDEVTPQWQLFVGLNVRLPIGH